MLDELRFLTESDKKTLEPYLENLNKIFAVPQCGHPFYGRVSRSTQPDVFFNVSVQII